MSTAVAVAVAAPPAHTALPSAVERHVSPRQYAPIAPSSAAVAPDSPAPKRARSNGSPGSAEKSASVERATSNGKASPTSSRNAAPPTIKVKKEPGSPSMSSSRPRPKRLDLSTSIPSTRGPQTARPSAPLTSRESAGLAIQDVGLACLSPGFQTNDPGMREQLQRSLDVRDQQRQIIEARQKGTKPGSSHDSEGPQRTQDTTLFGVQTRTPNTSRRKGPPPGLSIAAPSAAQFANDRVVQSAPLHQTFTGLRPGDQAYSRHAQHGPSALSQMSHIHHVPATQTNNRLPPIADVFANDRLDVQRGNNPAMQSPSHSSHSNIPPPIPSPGFPPYSQQGPPLSARGREFKSADEAVAGLSGGRDDMMPKVVHYGGVQPPTPPSPMPPSGAQSQYPPQHQQHHYTAPGAQQIPYPHSAHPDGAPRPDILARTSSMNGSRRRGREEFERDLGSSPPPGPSSHEAPQHFPLHHMHENKRAAVAVRGDERDEPQQRDWRASMGGAEKKEEFLRLCERAWDLFHS